MCIRDSVDGRDVRVIERGRGARLDEEALAAYAVVGELGGQQLERDVAIEARIVRQEDFAHAAAPEHAANQEAPDRERDLALLGAQPGRTLRLFRSGDGRAREGSPPRRRPAAVATTSET